MKAASGASKEKGFFRSLGGGDLGFNFALFGIVVLLILPVPTSLLDVLLAMSIGISLLILLIVVYLKEPSEFSVFPVILLAVTLFRLGLNVASTRLILLDGYAGQVIESFGNFVVRGNYVVGAVVFLILVVINFMVITKGAGRIAEVAARFTLDSLPGKQMSIDAELNAGIIDEQTATKRRLKLQKETDFYGAMDGASKFVRGDAVAGILITLINVIGGIGIGVMQHGMDLDDALHKYTLLSIGDGLVSQIPALIVSIGAGILITRTSEGAQLGEHLSKQLKVYPKAIGVAALMLFAFAILPGMPFVPFTALAVILGITSYLLKRSRAGMADGESFEDALEDSKRKHKVGPDGEEIDDSPPPGSHEDLVKMISAEMFAIEIGYGLVPLVDRKQSGDLLDRITGVRQKCAQELGIVIPPIGVRDNPDLNSHEYAFMLRGKELIRGEVLPNRMLAMNVADSDVELSEMPAVEPVFSIPSFWINEDQRSEAEMHGFTVVDANSVLITHLCEVLRDNAADMLDRESVQRLIERVKEGQPTLISELVPDLLNVGGVQRVLQNLLRERLDIKDLPMILELVADFASISKDPNDLSEYVRRNTGAYFVPQFESEPGILKALTLDPRLEQLLISRVKRTHFDISLLLDPAVAQQIVSSLNEKMNWVAAQGMEAILVTSSDVRLAFKRFFEPYFPKLAILAYQELPNGVQIDNLGTVQLQDESVVSAPAADEAVAVA